MATGMTIYLFSIVFLSSSALGHAQNSRYAFAGSAAQDEPVTGRDFLTWLWYQSEQGGTIKCDPYGELALVEPLTTRPPNPTARRKPCQKGDCPLRSPCQTPPRLAGKRLGRHL
jgi:hypothetical protein